MPTTPAPRTGRRRGVPPRPAGRSDRGCPAAHGVPGSTRAAVVLAALGRLAAAAPPPEELLGEVARRVRAVVPYDAGSWLVTDPATLVPTDAVIDGLPAALHVAFVEQELAVPDVAKFADLVREGRRVAVLSDATGGDPERSHRQRTLHRPNGLGPELRAVLPSAGAAWGAVCLARSADAPDFSPEEAAFVAAAAGHAGEALRTGLARAQDCPQAEPDPAAAPGVVVLDGSGAVAMVSDGARELLAGLPAPRGRDDVPGVVRAVAARVRTECPAPAHAGPARALVRTAASGWLALRGSRLDGGAVAVVVEPARRTDLAPLLVRVHGLTEREQEIAELLVRGSSTDEIAQALWLSRHTVRDHVKALYAKLGVSSRPQLTARLLGGLRLAER